jgi:hypothetical protein
VKTTTEKSITQKDRRAHNAALALALAGMNIYVFPSKDKTPMCAAWQKADDQLNADQTAAERAKFVEKHDFPPPHVGSTIDKVVIKRLWREFPDAVPSISCGPSGLFVIDADVAQAKEGKRAKDGPTKLATYVAENSIDVADALNVETRSGGKHLYFRNTESLDSKAGILRDLDCDVRGIGGQTVAPGAIREDGREYRIISGGDIGGLAHLPPVPEGIVKAVRTARETTEVKDEVVAASIQKLAEADPESFETIFDPIMFGYDLAALRKKDPEFGSHYDQGTGDTSKNRFKMTRILMREWPHMPVDHLMTFYDAWQLSDGSPGAGTFDPDERGVGLYNYRDVAREHAKGSNEYKVSNGDALIDVTTEDDEIGSPPPKPNEKQKARGRLLTTVSPRSLGLKGINALSPREFIYHKWYMKGAITILIAPGGRAKSSLTLSQAIDVSCGVDRLGAKLVRPRPVFLYNAEDPIAELERRAEAYMVFHDFTNEQKQLVQRNLHLQSGADGLLLFATQDRSDVITNEALVKSLVDYILLHKIELVILDPLVTLHNVQENDNTGMTQVADVFKRIVSATNVAMLIAHHSRKVQRGSGALDANDGRGAVAVINSARIVMNINDVGSQEKAAEFQITDDLWRYIIVSTGDKTNLSARDQSVFVFRLNSVLADNATDEYEADNTVAISQHLFVRKVGLGDDETLEVLAALDKPQPVGVNPGHGNYIGRLIADAADWNFDGKNVRADIKAVIASWLKLKWISPSMSEGSGKGANSRKPSAIYVRGTARPEAHNVPFEAVNDEE